MSVIEDRWDWPMFGWADDMRPALRRAAEAGRPAALATLFSVEGSAPRPVGTQMLIEPAGVSGFLSGGCVEADVTLHAAEVLADGRPRRLVYGRGGPVDIQLLCGARIEILVERLASDDPAVAALLTAERERRPALWSTDGERRTCEPGPAGPAFTVGAEPLRIVRCFDPPWRLVVVGGDPTALAIADLGARGGLETTLVRPKGPSRAPPLAHVAYRREAAADALAAIGMDAWTAVAVATHELQVDHAALVAALPSAAGYVGVLGSRARLPERLAGLRAAGVPEASIARLRAPMGLPLRGKSPWEIAVSVIGEIMEVGRRSPPAA